MQNVQLTAQSDRHGKGATIQAEKGSLTCKRPITTSVSGPRQDRRPTRVWPSAFWAGRIVLPGDSGAVNEMSNLRLHDLRRFYSILHALKVRVGGCRQLDTCSGRMSWPSRGVYFFFEQGEVRTESGSGQRVVRVGTHALMRARLNRVTTAPKSRSH